MATYIIVSIIAYLLGSISFSVIFSKKLAGFDVREKGSGNVEVQMYLEQQEKSQQF